MAEVAQNANLHKRTLNCLYPPLIYFQKIDPLSKKKQRKTIESLDFLRIFAVKNNIDFKKSNESTQLYPELVLQERSTAILVHVLD